MTVSATVACSSRKIWDLKNTEGFLHFARRNRAVSRLRGEREAAKNTLEKTKTNPTLCCLGIKLGI